MQCFIVIMLINFNTKTARLWRLKINIFPFIECDEDYVLVQSHQIGFTSLRGRWPNLEKLAHNVVIMNATKLLPIFPAKLWTCFTFLVQVCELVSTSSVGVCSWSGGQGDWCGLFHWTAPSSISPWNRLFDVQINVSLTIVNKLRFECKAFKPLSSTASEVPL